ncbi:phosphonate ABC transporter ATP-binding protein [Paenarthrobacter sp. OM7]|uniref:phosphonate ABC transporter ATP-binding protein n=1 Tax=Paenarthrobacter sp. OM7 TaxID=3041264 RepID=UPI002469AE0F|nr:phosphonate ABC transporter ATP-binding protein [Paenarthrobacter sp. OM7]WGM21698.1 phosphonate ABC transporter ATP-binding protein [Paenarthrobacter sp. OM7]
MSLLSPTESTTAALAPAGSPTVRARRLRVQYGEQVALAGIDLDVYPGEVVALLGHSGSGKSTLMKTLTGIAPFTADALEVAGRSVAQQNPTGLRELRSDVGYVFQHFNLVPRLTALANVLTGGLHSAGPLNMLGTFSRAQRTMALELLDRVSLAHKAKQPCRSLSGGEQQRVAIARALMQQPRLILADEPVASLDPRLAGTILGLLRDIAREEQIPVIVSLHVVGLARRYADRVLGLHSGELVFAGPATTITEKEVHQIYGTDTELLEN